MVSCADFVHAHLDEWQALAVFGGLLSTADSERHAEQILRGVGTAGAR